MKTVVMTITGSLIPLTAVSHGEKGESVGIHLASQPLGQVMHVRIAEMTIRVGVILEPHDTGNDDTMIFVRRVQGLLCLQVTGNGFVEIRSGPLDRHLSSIRNESIVSHQLQEQLLRKEVASNE